ncbi:MAG: hypothetical protein WAO98_02870 [Alphaproteobacteria bacterium]
MTVQQLFQTAKSVPVKAQPPVDSLDCEETAKTLREQMKEVEVLTDKISRVLENYEALLEHEGMRDKVDTLKKWMVTYREGLAAAQALSKKGNEWIADLCDRTKLSADELHRFEDEGGPPATKEQNDEAEKYVKATKKLTQIIPEIEHHFGNPDDVNKEQAH